MYSKIYVTGDTHTIKNIVKLKPRFFPEGYADDKFVHPEFVIICGDGGFLFRNDMWDSTARSFINECPWITLYVDGNHDNHLALSQLPVEIWNGGKIHKITSKLHHLMRGRVFTLEGSTFFTFGGGFTFDLYRREENDSWWQGELPCQAEIDEAWINLKEHDNKVDYIITHDWTYDMNIKYSGRVPSMEPYTDFSRLNLCDFLQEVEDKIEYRKWYSGHFHKDIDLPQYKHRLVFEDVVCIS